MVDELGGETRYRAFLSYNHKDRQQARWLHRRLEGYRIPRRLVGTEGEHGPVPARLAPIFRDREELPAAGDLSEKVRGALAVSDSLIVLCSPDAAASIWVAKEIETFRVLHPERPIFAAILDGEPAQCFPAALAAQGAEPLAADLRPEGDGRRLGLLKLVAGLAGTGLDALVQRDAQRRIRRVTAVTLAALALMLVTTALAIFAFTARAEAERQRAEAEGLVEFMLTDLRETLKKVGRLDALTSVNARALKFYAVQPLESLPAESLERRARLLIAMGEDAEKLGNMGSALALFREAHRVTDEQYRRDPDNPGRIFAHGQSEYWLGYLSYLQKDWSSAAAHWGSYQRFSTRLAADDPLNPEWLREAGYAEGNLCTLELARKRSVPIALAHCQAALAWMEKVGRLLPNDPRTARDLANRHAWLGDAWRGVNDAQRARAAYQTQTRLLQDLVTRDPGNADLKDQWMRALMSMAEYLDATGHKLESQRYNQDARDVALELIERDPSNKRWRFWLRRINEEASSRR